MPNRRVYSPTRRDLLKGGAALWTLSCLPNGVMAADDGPLTIEAREGTAELWEEGGPKADIWGYEGRVPGPVIWVRQGETLPVRFVNRLKQPSTIHWHGIRLDNAYDGVAGLTQEAVEPGQSFDYRIKAPDAGTFWYHPHNRSWEQLARGLYGVLIVEEAGAKAYDRELLFVFDDWRLNEERQIDEASFGNLHDWSHAGRLGNVLTTNGLPYFKERARPGERLRVRVVNTANARVLSFRFSRLKPQVIALDGQPVAPYELEADTLVIAPSQRADLIVDVPSNPGVFKVEEVSGAPFSAGEIVAEGAAITRDKPLPGDISLSPNPLNRSLSFDDALAVDLLMQGGAMGGLREASLNGETKDLRSLAQEGKVWAFNGIVGSHHDQALFSVARGRTIRMPIINDTSFPHAMHIHGHHFKVLSRNGVKPAREIWHDTVLTEPGEKVEVAFVADNPGKWMIHCHMLEHQAAGMTARFEVA
ncbi:multicopper oxidase family protein [Rhizobiales bacterium]|uniref:multicopper oxidase family protein n=1 Tax=Hongsoonwoonella zoysiae TaxID=2821844 RepID=UPI0015605027|nr:multicopper oxidase family protein [Hongsoonwoonella zoysiae]NRG18379.1 multicopper oxidase family protein [Hongsoonwoonella zoysiae]